MIVASNFKSTHTRRSTREFINTLIDYAKDNENEIRVYPSFTSLDCFELPLHVKIGAQNFYPVQKGSFTGEISAEHLAEFDIKSVLIGHSERRHIIGETQAKVAEKFAFAVEQGWEIIYCIGEPKEVREAGLESVMEYLWSQFDNIDITYDNLIVAYEPVWAIGTGLTASLDDIKETHAALREKITAPLLYGGSVKVENAQDVMSVENCDGVLVGTASWEVEDFCKMIAAANELTCKES